MTSIVPVDSGGLMLTYKCSCRCRHCLYGAGPGWSGFMDVNDATQIFQGLIETTSVLRGFHLAGGEPFLNFERLLSIQRLATEFGIPIEYVETNAFWCDNEEVTRYRFEQLKEAGLQCVLISCSPFHAERIPLERVKTAVKVGMEVFDVLLWIPEFYYQLAKIRLDKPIRLNEYVGMLGAEVAGTMIKDGYNLITGGRVGYSLGQFYERKPAEQYEGEHCKVELLKSGHAHFDPYGNFIPTFCSGISLGDARKLPTFFRSFDLKKLPIVQTLIDGGPYKLCSIAVEEFGYKPLRDGYIGKCHLCVDVRKWIRMRTSQFAELNPLQFYQELDEVVTPD